MNSLRRLSAVGFLSTAFALAGCPGPTAPADTGGSPSDAPTTDTSGTDGGSTDGGGRTDAGMPDAPVAVCGDGMVNGAESCDDGNTAAGDGCGAACAEEAGWTCDGADPTVCSADCGDGTVVGPEAGATGCDDGNTTAGDGCDAACEVEVGFSCSGEPSFCMAGCGDGIVAGTEGCDDGEMLDGDGCSSACAEEPGYVCSGSPSSCTSTCGDGVTAVPVETCDDMNTVDETECPYGTPTCTACDASCTGLLALFGPVCGDRIVNGPEACDDGNTEDLDACSNTCERRAVRSCLELLAAGVSTDGVYSIDPDGTGPVRVYCDMTTDGGGWTLVSSSTSTVGDQAAPYSENLTTLSPTGSYPGIWDGMRAVVTGNADLRFTCRTDAAATDNTVDLSLYSTELYRAATTGDDTASCTRTYSSLPLSPGLARRNNLTAVTLPATDRYNTSFMGESGFIIEDNCASPDDFTVDFDDHGMDSNQSDGTDWGADDLTPKCGGNDAGQVWFVFVRESFCGDGIVAPHETCEDGNSVGADGCSAACEIESGYTCAGTPSVCTPVCGDGLITGTETCEDGFATGGDGCSATCQTEPGFTCTGTPSVCSTTIAYAGPAVFVPDSGGPVADVPVAVGAVCNVAAASATYRWEPNHTFSGDLVVTLVAPGGVVTLSNRQGGGNDLDGPYTYAATGAVWPGTGSPIASGTYAANFTPILGTAANGTWILRVDDNASGDTGSVSEFSVNLTCTANP